MSGLFYLASIIAMFVIIGWYIANDGAKPSDRTRGLLAMKEPRDKTKPDSKKPATKR